MQNLFCRKQDVSVCILAKEHGFLFRLADHNLISNSSVSGSYVSSTPTTAFSSHCSLPDNAKREHFTFKTEALSMEQMLQECITTSGNEV
jgi:hypothetical protein